MGSMHRAMGRLRDFSVAVIVAEEQVMHLAATHAAAGQMHRPVTVRREAKQLRGQCQQRKPDTNTANMEDRNAHEDFQEITKSAESSKHGAKKTFFATGLPGKP